MKGKIFGLIICMLLIATVIPGVESQNNNNIVTLPQNNIFQVCSSENWTELQKLLTSDGSYGDFFGWSISIDGDTALIGAYHDYDNGEGSGSAYVFVRSGATWIEQQKLLASDGEAEEGFGYSVSLSGNTALIGARYDDDKGYRSGSAYVFTRTGTSWTQQTKLFASDSAEGDTFGYSVCLDGDTALIGAPHDDDNKGSAYVFTCSDTIWTQQQKLIVGGNSDDYFGWSVSLDGDTALVGVWGDDDNGDRSGSAYVFTRSYTTWSFQDKLHGSDNTESDYFGWSVSLDGDTAFIAAPNDFGRGSVYAFTRSGTTWTQQAKLLASDGATADHFGYSVALDGNTALIGTYQDDDNGNESGSTYVFTHTGSTWTQQAKLLASDGELEDNFGNSVALDGNTALIGAPGDDDQGGSSGSTYVFIKEEEENHPPNTPTITGPTNGKINVAIDYNFTTTDADNDTISYYIDWGDDTNSGWIGPYASGNVVTKSHTWTKKGDYTIKAKAKDSNGNESDWGELSVTMPCSYKILMQWVWDRFFQRFPHAFPRLRHLMGY